MKTRNIAALLLGLCVSGTALAEAFTYQGKLDDNGSPASGTYDFRFRLLNNVSGGTSAQVSEFFANDIQLNNGVFTASVDFGIVFDGTPFWIEVAVRPGNSTGSYTPLQPNQPVTAAPEAQIAFSILSNSIASGHIIDGSVRMEDTDGNIQARVVGSCAAGSSIRSIAADGSVTCETDDTGNSGWSFTGDAISSGQFIGTTNSQPLEWRVNNQPVMRITDASDAGQHAPNIVAGASFNTVGATVAGATIGGGGGDPTTQTCGDGTEACVNSVAGNFGTIAGGWGNVNSGLKSSIGGGENNWISREYSTIAGGQNNRIVQNGATIGGGFDNYAGGSFATVAGGQGGRAGGPLAAIGGGQNNQAIGWYATTPGGADNQAGGDYSLAAGRKAFVRHSTDIGGSDTDGDEGTFIWADSTNAIFSSTGPNQFLVRASGGMGVGTNSPQNQLTVQQQVESTLQLVTTQPGHHVAQVNNTGSSFVNLLTGTVTTAHVLALTSAEADPSEHVNFTSFFGDGGNQIVGAIEGNGAGGVLLTSGAADFAEYLPSEQDFAPGTVVGLKAGRLVRDTAEAEKVLVISTAPILKGNNDMEGNRGRALAALLGQVPVLSEGPVQAGDWLLATDNGKARALRPHEWASVNLRQVVGKALTADENGQTIALVGLPPQALTQAALTAERERNTLQAQRIHQLTTRVAELQESQQQTEQMQQRLVQLESLLNQLLAATGKPGKEVAR